MTVRPALPVDAPVLAALLRAYPAERFPDHIGTPAERLERDVLGGDGPLRVLLAAHRGLGVAVALVAAVCAASRSEGGRYLTGAAFERASAVGSFYERIAVTYDSAECHCAGAAFRRLADLHGRPPRAIARGLPPREWNYRE